MVVGQTVHPDKEQLRDYGAGRLPPEEAAAIEKHLFACERCCCALEDDAADTFVLQLRQARPPVLTDTEGYVLGPQVEILQRSRSEGLLAEAIPHDLQQHPRYQVLRLLGRGGMGSVYLAEHRRMGRAVALKVIDPSLLRQSGALSRFQQEVRAAAQLDHANIVAAYDADQAGDLHFLVMEYVEGQNLADYLAEKGSLGVAQACDAARQAALGLQHAHELGMVHRDIKPHNLMRVPSGVVKVLDFGLARNAFEPGGVIADGAPAVPHLTGVGTMMGTADYIAPEQARDAHEADARADIYSLGCTLYHLLAGKPPFPEGTALEKLQHHACEEPAPLRTLRPEVPEGLSAVVERMMGKHPEDRYQTAATAAEALRPYADAAPRRQGKRRWAAAFALVALAAVLLAAAVIRISAGKDREIVVETDDPQIAIVVQGDRLVRIVDPKTGKAYQLDRTDLTLALADDPDGLQVALDGTQPIVLKRKGRRIAAVRLQRQDTAGAAEQSEAGSLSSPDKVGEVRSFLGHDKPLGCVAISPDGRLAVSGPAYARRKDGVTLRDQPGDYALRIWDIATGKELRRLPERHLAAYAVAFSPDGRHLLSGHLGEIRMWDVKTWALLKVFEIRPWTYWGAARALAYSPDGRRFAAGVGEDPTVTLWDPNSGEVLKRLRGCRDSVRTLAVSADGQQILAGSLDGTARIWKTATGKEIRCLHGRQDAINAVALAPDGREALTGSKDGSIKVWDIQTGQLLRTLKEPSGEVISVAYTPDGRFIVSGGNDGPRVLNDEPMPVDLWVCNAQTGVARRFPGHQGLIYQIAVTPDGQHAITASRDRSLRLWRLPKLPDSETVGEVRRFGGGQGVIGRVYFLPDGDLVLSSGEPVSLWNIHTGQKVRDLAKGTGRHDFATALSPDGRHALTRTQLWDVKTGKELRTLEGTDDLWGIAFSPDGRRAVFGAHAADSRAGENTLWISDVNSSAMVKRLGNGEAVRAVDYSPDGTRVAAGHYPFGESTRGVTRVYDVQTGEVVRSFETPTGAAGCVRFSPDGKKLLTASHTTMRLWDLQSGKLLKRFDGHSAGVWWAVFTADGRRIVSAGGDDGTVRVWDVRSGKELHCFRGHTAPVLGVAVSPDGRYAVSGSMDGTLRLWRLPSVSPSTAASEAGDEAVDQAAEPAGPPLQPVDEVRRWKGHSFHVHSIVVSTDGRVAWSASNDLRKWELPTGRLIQAFEMPGGLDGAMPSPDEKELMAILGLPTAGLRHYSTLKVEYKHGFGRRGNFRYYQGCWTPDGQYFLTGGDGGVARLWDVHRGTVSRTFRGHQSPVLCVAVNPEGTLALTGSADHRLLLYDLKEGKELHCFASQINHPGSAQFTPDGRGVLTCGQDYVICLFDVHSSQERRAFRSPDKEVVWDRFCLLNGGRFFLSSGSDMVLRLWEVDTGKEVYRAALPLPAASLAVTPDRRYALIGTAVVGDILQVRLPDVATAARSGVD
jgi:WD40 repeat protein